MWIHNELIPSVLEILLQRFSQTKLLYIRWLYYYDVNSLYPKESPGGVRKSGRQALR